MGFAVIAAFPLGTYRGHVGEDEPDPFPSPARLLSALLAAAGQGPRALLDPGAGVLGPDVRDEEALRWVESHPPDGVLLPTSAGARRMHVRYRDSGTNPFEGTKARGRWVDKVAKDPPESSVALAGEVAWTWSETPPPKVREALEGLVGDVSHVGTAESPVRLRVGDAEPTHRLDPSADLWDPGGVDLDVPLPGRTRALIDAHTRFVTARVRDTKHSPSDSIVRPPRELGAVALARYVPATPPPTPMSPWTTAFLLDLADPVRLEDRVRMAVAVHRALVALVGDGAPLLVTGRYPDGSARPANHLAVHLLDGAMPSIHVAGTAATLAVLLPTGADPQDAATVHAAMGELRVVRGPGGRERQVSSGLRVVDATRFWDEGPATGGWWRTAVPAISDVRPPRGRSWSMEDTTLLAVALAWRDHVGGPGRGFKWMAALTERVRAAGVSVAAARRLHRSDVARFAHHVHPHAVIAPFHATLSLGTLGSGRDLVAIGQTRHLGGGLLVPEQTGA